MARFYFHLTSMDRHIRDNSGKELATANEAYDHARKLIDKILFHMGSDDAQGWKVVISSDSHNAPIIVPFPESCPFPGRRGWAKQLGMPWYHPFSNEPDLDDYEQES